MAGEFLYQGWWKMKDQSDDIADMKWSTYLGIQSFLDNDRVHEY